MCGLLKPGDNLVMNHPNIKPTLEPPKYTDTWLYSTSPEECKEYERKRKYWELENKRIEELKQYGKNRKERRANGYREKKKKFKLTK